MLYIFSVEQGTMLTFEMDYACQSVDNLKSAIDLTQNVPKEKQVLLISGGECLNNSRTVASYGAGTDTNPIFLFNKTLYADLQLPSSPEVGRHQFNNPHYERQEALTLQKLQSHCALEPTMVTIRKRTQFAQELYELSVQEAKLCRQKVHEQHLQQQAWSAVIANLEDAGVAFEKRSRRFLLLFETFVARNAEFQMIQDNFPEDCMLLARLPLLTKLTQTSQHQEMNDLNLSSTDGLPATLLDYVIRSNPENSLEDLAEQCRKGLTQLTPEVLEEMRKMIKEILDKTSQPNFKHIKGLEDRLSGLEELMRKADDLVIRQEPNCQSFLLMQANAAKLKDSERSLMIPDLCSTQPEILQKMHLNYTMLKDITRRCSVAKNELSENLKYRLAYITQVEGSIGDISTKLKVYEKRIETFSRILNKMEQIHSAPQIYARSVAEVVRRKRFSSLYLKWAGGLSAHCKEVYRNELAQRRAYKEQTRSHFLRKLFPGLDDVPPPYATSTPEIFDDRLPPVELVDVEQLKRAMPADLAGLLESSTSVPSLSLMDIDNVSHSASDISSKKTVESDAVSHQEVRVYDMVTASSPADPGYVTDNSNNVLMELSVEKVGTGSEAASAQEQKICVDVLHCEEMREKVRGCVNDLRVTVGAFVDDTTMLAQDLRRWTGELAEDATKVATTVAAIVQGGQDKEKSLERQLEIELHKLKDAQAEIELYYDQLRQMKELVDHSKQEIEIQKADYDSRLTKLQMEHELELENVEARYKQELTQLNARITEIQEQNERLIVAQEDHATQLANVVIDHEGRLARLHEEFTARELAVREDLERHHKNELESLRCRYKLTTSVMSTSSSTIGSDVVSSLSSPQGGVTGPLLLPAGISHSQEIENRWRLREMELEERIRQLERMLQDRNNDSPSPAVVAGVMDTSCTSAMSSLQMMVDSQYRVMAESAVGTLAGPGIGGGTSTAMVESTVVRLQPSHTNNNNPATAMELIEQLRAKEAEIQRIQMRLVSSCGTGSLPSLSSDRVSILSCVHGDVVLLAYDDNHENYVIFMLGPLLHFLHRDSLEELRLSTDRERSTKRWIIGEVVDKEYCEARRAVNRYRLAVGTRFFRVKVRPWDRQGAMRREQERRQVLKAAATATTGAATLSVPLGNNSENAGANVASAVALATTLSLNAATTTTVTAGVGGPSDGPNLPASAASPVASPATSI
ncbi:RB1-inducible coiled-coil protein 1-like isoform X1 [Varroa destructor]|uniref:RB1-inducible coiled-coil protein 1 n=1 Tax=Varroa destructor TaxID=109461 RepID=A0A7M7L3E4_VARDE|nr:RB1-inducible coiled-coil protein 1-like isoform X1 [Varroa destructor]XP_022673248.1 RB1-inducible coiled-coil protein 1-like isoform X1 [Varroa destructor]XP_022673259.1 RB1-inducible coiled-coil protein 1-like isoform X1 [Varroa destructor]XP_022673265.1 RB1-inducible coiled-coil protein 1-like isoform X1 [Varroa destructor]XP_022673274.1 RB1-inducible coiled-coil protein 1-like isoform X1 [Varroa destructor]XP_022673279.1 RB1-inducible coiled-coil protein 1-like isoform X1 [Varroa destr